MNLKVSILRHYHEMPSEYKPPEYKLPPQKKRAYIRDFTVCFYLLMRQFRHATNVRVAAKPLKKHLGPQNESILLAHVFESDQKHAPTFFNIPNKLKL